MFSFSIKKKSQSRRISHKSTIARMQRQAAEREKLSAYVNILVVDKWEQRGAPLISVCVCCDRWP